jgi:hypothetical protein
MDDDPTFAPPQRDEVTSPLDALKASLQTEYRNPPTTLPVKARPGVEVRFDTNIDAELLQAWRKRSRDKRKVDQVDPMRFAATVIANKAEVFLQDGQEVVVDGSPINFRSNSILEWTGATSVHEAVRMVYGMDSHVLATCGAVLSAAGYDDDMEDVSEEDPT